MGRIAGASSPALGELGLAVVRVVAGTSLALLHGIGKLPPSPRFVDGVGGLGFPLPIVFAWAAGISEFAGGLLLAAGLFTRPAAFFVGVTMSVAAFLRHAGDPLAKRELALVYLAVAIAFLLYGSGRYGLDALFGGKRR